MQCKYCDFKCEHNIAGWETIQKHTKVNHEQKNYTHPTDYLIQNSIA